MKTKLTPATFVLCLLVVPTVLPGCRERPVPTAAELMTGAYERPDFSGIEIAYSEAEHVQTLTGHGTEQHYLVQEPERLEPNAPILIYMHGADGDETQGMDPEYADGTFARLRSILYRHGWIYVTARIADFDGLKQELKARYGPRPFVLSGSSLGGAQSLREAMASPRAYAGVIVMCPALPMADAKPAKNLTMPVYIECGANDVLIAEVSRKMADTMKRRREPYVYVEIPGGTHRTPIEQIDWKRALDFVEAHRP
jgi:pimeloyl-ACP methyl ester carboxylesterase